MVFALWKMGCYCSVTKSCPVVWTAACQASLSFTISQSLLKLMSIESVMPCNSLILCHPLLLLPSIFPSIRVFSDELAFHTRWSKFWTFSISPTSEYLGLISFRTDWFDLLAVQGSLKSLLQHHSSKASIFQVLMSTEKLMLLNYGPTLTSVLDYWKTITLTIWTFVKTVGP